MSVTSELFLNSKSWLYALFSYVATVAIFLNLNSFHSPIIGFAASAIYLAMNSISLGNAFFKEQSTAFRLTFGALLFIMLLGFVGWLIMIIYNLDVFRVTIVLAATATISFLLNEGIKHRNATR